MPEKNKDLKSFMKPKRIPIISCIFIAILGVMFGVLSFIAVYRLLMLFYHAEATTGKITTHVLFVFCVLALQILCHYISTAISHKTAFSILENVRIAITEKMMRIPLGITQTKGSGYFKNLLIDEIERLEYPFAHALPEVISGVMLPVVVMIIMFFVDVRMALAIVIPVGVVLALYFPLYIGIMNDFQAVYYTSIEDMNAKVIEYIKGIKEMKIFGRSDDAYTKYEQSIDNYQNAVLKLYNKMYYVSSPAHVLLSSILVSVLCVGGMLFTDGRLSFEIFLFTIIITLGIGTPILKFTEFMDNIFHIKNGNRLVKDVLSTPELTQSESRFNPANYEVKFSNVSFAYDDKTILDNISLTFPECKKTAIVGPSGSGKSTIANLISRFWEVNEGSITLGGVDYKDIPLDRLMENINYVTQDTFLFNISIKDNIKIGNPKATDDEIVKAAKNALCDEFIHELENGYDTKVGDTGSKLSGGQRQRIVIARAMLRNAPLLILDEATAFADMENQNKLQQSLAALCKDKTLIIIAHRLSTIKDCDQIIVVNDGKAESTGTHDELLGTSEVYRKMWQIHEKSTSWTVGRNEVKKL
ncbi:MAG: ABC transporter ATP-binding protein [Velocimicrobium sp.]